jgi:N-acetylglucosamine kinase-like BadF-type ATPase
MSGLYLGIDVGGTASRWAAIDGDGNLMGRGTAAGATGHLFNPVEREVFRKMAGAVAAEAKTLGPFSGVHAGITGLGEKASPESHVLLSEALGVPTMQINSGNDMDLAFRSVFKPGEGHMISAGTGSIGLHIAAHGSTVRVGGRGILIDDGGSGTWIALKALDLIYRRIDEHGTPWHGEQLAAALYAAVGGEQWENVRDFVYGSDRGRIGTLARAVASAADQGDKLALDILEAAALELARLAHALIGRAGAKPVAFVGGIITLHPAIKQGLGRALPGSEITYPTIDAALTAAQLARQAALTE